MMCRGDSMMTSCARDAAHHVVNAFAALVQLPFDFQGGKFVRHHAHPPSLAVALRAGLAIGDDFVGGFVFVPFTEGAKPPFLPLRRRVEVVRPFRPRTGYDYPTANDRIFAEVWHGEGSEVRGQGCGMTKLE